MTADGQKPLPEHNPQAAARQAAAEAPGRLHGEAWLILQTRDAHRLALGRAAQAGKPRILGLAAFAGLAGVIYACARLDDPYADDWLLRIEEALEHARQTLRELRHGLEEQLAALRGIEIAIASSTAPVRLPLRASHPYAGAAALVLADYDHLMLAALTARHYGLIDRAAFGRLRSRGGHVLRRLFASAAGYRYCGAGRKELAQGGARAEQARRRLGELPEEVLSGRRRAALAPEITSTPPAHAERSAPEPSSGAQGIEPLNPPSPDRA